VYELRGKPRLKVRSQRVGRAREELNMKKERNRVEIDGIQRDFAFKAGLNSINPQTEHRSSVAPEGLGN